jgi:hypothetical protein
MTLAAETRMYRAAIRAARKEGLPVVEIQHVDGKIVRIPLVPDTPPDKEVAEGREIVL